MRKFRNDSKGGSNPGSVYWQYGVLQPYVMTDVLVHCHEVSSLGEQFVI